MYLSYPTPQYLLVASDFGHTLPHPPNPRHLLPQFLLILLTRHKSQRALDLIREMQRQGSIGHYAHSEEEARARG
jgi:hypothetical protein